jgi:hypothetical protein
VLIIFILVRFLILLTVFELLPKTCNFTICSIFSNSGHVGWCMASPDTILKLDTLVMIQTKFGFHWSNTFRGEDFWKSLRRTTDDGRRRQTPSDGNSSPDPNWPFGSGELKKMDPRGNRCRTYFFRCWVLSLRKWCLLAIVKELKTQLDLRTEHQQVSRVWRIQPSQLQVNKNYTQL